MQNDEVMFDEYLVNIYFCTEGCWDPTLLQEDSGDGSKLGTTANYRYKFMVSPGWFMHKISKVSGANEINTDL